MICNKQIAYAELLDLSDGFPHSIKIAVSSWYCDKAESSLQLLLNPADAQPWVSGITQLLIVFSQWHANMSRA